MELKLEILNAFCATRIFTVNGINAESRDFGNQTDNDSENAEDYGCGNMEFTRIEPTEEILLKYKITKAEYAEICSKLEKGLSFGYCGWCV